MNQIVKLALELSKATGWEITNYQDTHRSVLLVYGLTPREIGKLQQLVEMIVPAPHKYEVVGDYEVVTRS